jgi:hypothetical protein
MATPKNTFNDRPIRVAYDKENKEWKFSAADVVGALAEPKNPRKYWNDFKKRTEDNQLSAKIGQLKMPATDGKMYNTDVLNREGAVLLARRITRSPHLEAAFIEWLDGFDLKEGWYVLKHKNIDVLEIELDGGLISSFGRTFNAEHLPVGTVQKNGLDPMILRDWWKGRSIPASREGLQWTLQVLGMTTPQELLDKSFGLSLSDHYWISPQNADLKWEGVNFFHNSFSDDIGDLLFGKMDWEGLDPKAISLISPDNTSDGVLKKKWKIIDGKRCLIKGGTRPNNQEVANEVLASRICDRLGIPYIDYGIIELDGIKYCVCEDFITGDTELVTAWHIKNLIKSENHISDYDSFISKAEEFGIENVRCRIDMMIVLDFIIVNTDRHYNNFGLIRDANTLEWLSVAPIYDSGTSMWCTEFPEDMDAKDPKIKSKPFRTKHMEQIKLVKDLSWLDLDKLDGIENEYTDILNDSVHNPEIMDIRNRRLCNQLRRRIELLRKLTESKAAEGTQ